MFYLFLSGAPFMEIIANVCAIIVTFLIIIPCHSAVVAACTRLLGAQTEKTYEKFKINPFVHQGLFSIIALILFNFAWPTTSYMDTSALRKRKKSVLLCPFAGLAVQMAFVILAGIAFGILSKQTKVGYEFSGNLISIGGSYSNMNNFLGMIFYYIVRINTLTAIINLIPLLPFDGYYFLRAFAHSKFRNKIRKIADYVIIAVFVLFLTTLPQRFLLPYIDILCSKILDISKIILGAISG